MFGRASDKERGFGSGVPGTGQAVEPDWFVQVNGAVFGPYVEADLGQFAQEGRIADDSPVARGGWDAWQPFGAVPELAKAVAPVLSGGQAQAEVSEPRSSNFVVIADKKSRRARKFERALMNLGPTYKVADKVWLVQAARTTDEVANHLAQFIGQKDRLLVVDATHDQAFWTNCSIEEDGKLRRLWQGR